MTSLYGVPSEVLVRWLLDKDSSIKTWVDLGCGNGEYLRAIGWLPKEGLGVDLAGPEELPRNFKFEKADINDWLDSNTGIRFDIATMFDVVEHFPKEESLGLLAKAKKVARRLLVATPSGFLKQDAETDPSLADNPWLWHRSGFSAKDLEDLGFTVFVLKNAHIKPAGNDRSFDKLVAYYDAERDPKALLRSIWLKAAAYNLLPRHLYRTLRDNLILS